jgi:hypothetical protein
MTDKSAADRKRPGTPAQGDGQGPITAGHGQTQANSAADNPKAGGREGGPEQKTPPEDHAVLVAGKTAHERKPGRG